MLPPQHTTMHSVLMCATEVNYKYYLVLFIIFLMLYRLLYNTCCSYISIVWFYYIATRFLHHLLSPLSAKEPEVLYDVRFRL